MTSIFIEGKEHNFLDTYIQHISISNEYEFISTNGCTNLKKTHKLIENNDLRISNINNRPV